MPVPKKKRITAEKILSTSEPSSPLLPEQQAFHQHLQCGGEPGVRDQKQMLYRRLWNDEL
jgi:hypothetical protein